MRGMAGPYFRDWRKYRNLTQEQVADRLSVLDDPRLPATTSSLSRIENGKQEYTRRIVEALAEVYQCEPHELLGHNPMVAGEVIDYLHFMDRRSADQAIEVLKALHRTAEG